MLSLTLKITHETNTEKPFYMVTPVCDGESFYPIFTGTKNEVFDFICKCSNCTCTIQLSNDEIRDLIYLNM